MPKADVMPLTVCASIFTAIGTIFVLLRIYVRARLRDVFGIDDWLLFISMLWGLSGYITEMIAACRYFTRIHLSAKTLGTEVRWEVAMSFNTVKLYRSKVALSLGIWGYKSDISLKPQLAQVGICLYSLANMFSRMAILCTYLRFTPREQKIMRGILLAALVMTGTLGVGTVLLATVSCYPPHLIMYNRDFMDKIHRKELVCLAPRQVFYWMGIGNVVNDAVTFMMPFLLLRKLKSKKMRQELYFLFGFGLLVIIISIIRIPIVSVLKKQGNFSARNLVKVWIFTQLESNSILVVASIPTLKPLYRKLRGLPSGLTVASKSASGAHSGQRPYESEDRIEMSPRSPYSRKISCPDPDESILRDTIYLPSPAQEGTPSEGNWTNSGTSCRVLC
ncbi:hypothetical protein TWF106_010612 [Orbilia oligospora]|uniref:Rhodopsin domain-containing protein n=2 Tax=Orbilia oligospora TaxID=2813651 RepID=A0A6G1MGX1_ORBOL|nr:hypothetical protein TWF191_000641 [Orbilia oligospora]KAF3227124.1 hypothetical protein TWF106_010612 [Orbilia oligospora]KAF3256396.1 hypothetical protein TWF192_001821 [Orbilia oligospora]